MMSSDQIGSRRTKDYNKDACYSHYVLFDLLLYRADNVFLQRFSEGTGILAELVRLKESPTSMEPEPAMDYVCCVVLSILYADDTCIVLRPPRGLANIMEVIGEGYQSFANGV